MQDVSQKVIQRFKDWFLERRIAFSLRRMLRSKDRTDQRRIALFMAGLCKARSPAKVERMEKRMGLQQRKTALSS